MFETICHCLQRNFFFLKMRKSGSVGRRLIEKKKGDGLIMASGIACRRVRMTVTAEACNMVDRNMQPWFTVYIFVFDIGHPCHDQLTPIRTRYLLTISRDHIVGSSLQLIELTYFLKLTFEQVLVFNWISGSC